MFNTCNLTNILSIAIAYYFDLLKYGFYLCYLNFKKKNCSQSLYEIFDS